MIPKTAQERLECYEKALKIYEDMKKDTRVQWFIPGVCVVLRDQICKESIINTSLTYAEFTEKYFPEFYSLKPVPAYGYAWWERDDIHSRIQALQQAIKLTEDAVKSLL